jgi:hypothetical protein
MDDWGTVQTVILGVLAVITTITTALVGIQIGTVRTLRESNNDLRARVGDLETERLNDKAKIVERDGKISERDSEIALLKAMVTGKVEWIAVTDQLENHHREALEWWEKADGHLSAIPEALRAAVTEAVERAIPLAVEAARERS